MARPDTMIEVHQYRLPPDNKRALAFVQQALDSIMGTFKRLAGIGTIDGTLLKNNALSATPLRIVHGLGRLPAGFIVAGLDANATVFQTAADASSITLQASANCTANVWVF